MYISGKLLQIWGECLGGISHPVVMTLQDMASSTFMGSVYDSQLRSENRMRDQNFAVFERHSLPTLQTTEEATNNHNWIYCLLNNSWSWKTLCLQTMIIGFEKEGTQGLANIQTRKHLGIVWFPAKEAHLREQPCWLSCFKKHGVLLIGWLQRLEYWGKAVTDQMG